MGSNHWAASSRRKIIESNTLVRIVAPAVVTPGERFSLRLSAVGADQMPLDRSLTLRLGDRRGWDGLPEAVEVGTDGVTIEGVSLEAPGAYWLSASFAEEEGAAVFSNPVSVREGPAERIYFGDLHVHTTDGMCQNYIAKEPRFAFDYIHHVSFLDFAALTDHVDGLTPAKWQGQRDLVRRYDAAGRFVPFLAFEASHASGYGGDNNGYFRGYEGDYFWMDHPEMSSTNPSIPISDLWRFLDQGGRPAMTVPHHTARAGKRRSWDEGWYNPEREWLYEIYSCWGSSEERSSRYPLFDGNSDEPAYFRDALNRGCRFGAIASGDDHTTMPGSESQQGYPGNPRLRIGRHKGLAAVYAERLNRDALWEGFRRRRTYATTFDRSLVEFGVDGLESGRETPVTAESRRRRRVSLTFLAGTPSYGQAIVSIVRNGSVCYTSERLDATKPIEVSFVDEQPFEALSIRGAKFAAAPFLYYYARIDYPAGGTAWSSPVWLSEA